MHPEWFTKSQTNQAKTSYVSQNTNQLASCLDAEKLTEAKRILSQLGMNFSEAVNIFTNLIVAKQGLPFGVALPNEESKAAMLDVRARKNLEPITLERLQRETGTQ